MSTTEYVDPFQSYVVVGNRQPTREKNSKKIYKIKKKQLVGCSFFILLAIVQLTVWQ
jgi:hypothetical protein